MGDTRRSARGYSGSALAGVGRRPTRRHALGVWLLGFAPAAFAHRWLDSCDVERGNKDSRFRARRSSVIKNVQDPLRCLFCLVKSEVSLHEKTNGAIDLTDESRCRNIVEVEGTSDAGILAQAVSQSSVVSFELLRQLLGCVGQVHQRLWHGLI